ncbi:ATP-binding cassette domain-containing protein, partial [Pseudomonas aeruginosa]|uniref:ATP-binding cassette domain-containing protein n=1 Tax=Pseudomonas aeruginosa TaxID=287 RepID=UPI003C6E052F
KELLSSIVFLRPLGLRLNAELHIEDNERVCLVGRNGAGKSTLMKILNREQGLDDGRIIYEQDLIVARLQQDPPRNVEGSVYDF